MKKKLLVSIMLLFSISIFAQQKEQRFGNPPKWEQIKNHGTSARETIKDMVLDENGNSYIVGEFSGETNLDDQETLTTISAKGDIFITKIDSQGSIVWKKQTNASIFGRTRINEIKIVEDKLIVLIQNNHVDDNVFGIQRNVDDNFTLIELDLDGNVTQSFSFFDENIGINTSSSNSILPSNFSFEFDPILNVYYVVTDQTFLKLNYSEIFINIKHNQYINDLEIVDSNLYITFGIVDSSDNFLGYELDIEYNDYSHFISFDSNLNLRWIFNKETHLNSSSSKIFFGNIFSTTSNNIYISGLKRGAFNIEEPLSENLESNPENDQVFFAAIDLDTGNLINVNSFLLTDSFYFSYYGSEYKSFKIKTNIKNRLFFHFHSRYGTTKYYAVDTETKEISEESLSPIPQYYFTPNSVYTATRLPNNDLEFSNNNWNFQIKGDNNRVSILDYVVDPNTNESYSLNLNNSENYELIKYNSKLDILWKKDFGTSDIILNRNINEEYLKFQNNTLYFLGGASGILTINEEEHTYTPNTEEKYYFLNKITPEGVSDLFILEQPELVSEFSDQYSFTVLKNNTIALNKNVEGKKIEVYLFDENLSILSNKTVIGNYIYDTQINSYQNKISIISEISGHENILFNDEIIIEQSASEDSKNGNNILINLDENLNYLSSINWGHGNQSYYSWPYTINFDTEGNKYILGAIFYHEPGNSIDFNGYPIQFYSSNKSNYTYFAKLNIDNEFEWVKTIGHSSRYSHATGTSALDKESNFYSYFYTNGQTLINDNIEINSKYENGSGLNLIKFNKDGEIQSISTIHSYSGKISGIYATDENISIFGYGDNYTYFDEENEFNSFNGENHFIATQKLAPLNNENFIKETTQTLVYPNPAKDKINIDTEAFQNEVYVQIYNTNGGIVYSQTLENYTKKITIDLSFLKANVYFIKITDGNKTETSKFIKN